MLNQKCQSCFLLMCVTTMMCLIILSASKDQFCAQSPVSSTVLQGMHQVWCYWSDSVVMFLWKCGCNILLLFTADLGYSKTQPSLQLFQQNLLRWPNKTKDFMEELTFFFVHRENSAETQAALCGCGNRKGVCLGWEA